MKEQIDNLVIKGKLTDAVDILIAHTGDSNLHDDLLNLSSRIYHLDKDKGLSIITTESYNIQRNNLVASLLSYKNEIFGSSTDDISQPIKPQPMRNLRLNDIVKKYRRRNPDIAQEATDLIKEIADYELSLTTVPGFDNTRRRLEIIKAKKEAFINKVDSLELDSREGKIKQIKDLLNLNLVPEYKELDGSYKIAQGLGFKDDKLEAIIANQVEDSEIQISAAEQIEGFLNTI